MNKESLKARITSLEKQLFEIVSIIMLVLMGFSCFEGIAVGSSVLTIVFNGLLSVIGGVLFYLSRYRGLFNQLRYVLIAILNVFLIFYWYWMYGIYGPTAIAGIVVGVVSIVLSEPKRRVWIFSGFIAILLFLVFSQKYTDWVRVTVNLMQTIHLDYALFAVACLLIINFLKSRFDRERISVNSKNFELQLLNDDLKKALQEKEEVINELRRAQDQLIESEKMASIGKLTAGIAHELNNPLNYIGGVVLPVKRDLDEIKELIPSERKNQSEVLFEEIDLLMKNVDEGTERAKAIIDKLGSLLPDRLKHNGESGETFDLNEVVESIVKEVQLVEPSINIDLKKDGELKVYVDPGDLHMILTNVVQNAIYAIPADREGQVVISLHPNKGMAEILVQDNGMGVPKKDIKNITDPFYTTKPTGSGNGLGMFLVHNLIKVHHGKLKIESKLGSGTDVLIAFPIHKD